jgi:SAM-dependent methyltransferase
VNKSTFQSVYDFLLAPLRFVFFPESWCERLGLTSLERERIINVLPHVKGRLLDVGCGNNLLAKTYGNGIGVDVYDWGGGAVILHNPHELPFEDNCFDTITLLASLNHIPDRCKMLKEIRRIQKVGGQAIVTMINPIIGYLVHRLFWRSEDKVRGMKEGECHGMWSGSLIQMFAKAGYRLSVKRNFEYGINAVYIFTLNG